MANLTITQSVLNNGVPWVEQAGAASQEMLYNRRDNAVRLLVRNTDAAPCRIKVTPGGYGGTGQVLDVDIAAGENAIVGPVESFNFKDSDNLVVFQILDQDNTVFSGTVTNVLLTQLNDPKFLVD